jgi:DNA-binding NtrC family response regulator
MSEAPKHKILLVEDDPSFGGLMRDFLRMNDLDVELCTDGEMGREAFHRDKFDLCILDVMMPKLDGFSLATEIKKNEPRYPRDIFDGQNPSRRYVERLPDRCGRLYHQTVRLRNFVDEGECHPQKKCVPKCPRETIGFPLGRI